MTKVEVNTEFMDYGELRSGDIIVTEDNEQWLVIRLEDNSWMIYDMQTHRYMVIPKDCVASNCKAGDTFNYLPLDIANKRISQRYGATVIRSRVIKAEKMMITITELK